VETHSGRRQEVPRDEHGNIHWIGTHAAIGHDRRRRLKTILVVDDEEHIRELATLYLEQEGYGVLSASDGEEVLEIARAKQPDLIVLDVMMPGLDGLDVCRELRKESDVPVLMLTARSEEIDRIVGLELGADDYMGKPFNPRELAARVKAILRRAEGGEKRDRGSVSVGPLTVDWQRREVTLDGASITLRNKEFELLRAAGRTRRR